MLGEIRTGSRPTSHPTCTWRPSWVTTFEFRRYIWHQSTGLSCGIVCVIQSLGVLIQYRRVSNTQSHDDSTCRASTASRGKSGQLQCALSAVQKHRLPQSAIHCTSTQLDKRLSQVRIRLNGSTQPAKRVYDFGRPSKRSSR